MRVVASAAPPPSNLGVIQAPTPGMNTRMQAATMPGLAIGMMTWRST